MATPTVIPSAALMCGLLVSTCPTNEDIIEINPEYRDDSYDPRKPEYVQPASANAVANANVERLQKQIMQLNGHIAARSWSEDTGQLRAHYQQVIEELQAEVLRNEEEVKHQPNLPRIGSFDSDTAGQCGALNDTDECGVNARRARYSSWVDEDFQAAQGCHAQIEKCKQFDEDSQAASNLDINVPRSVDEGSLFDASGEDLSHPILPSPPSPTAPLHRDKIQGLQGLLSTIDKAVDQGMLSGIDPSFNELFTSRAGPSAGVSIASRTTAASGCSQLESSSDCDIETDSDGEFFCLVRRRPVVCLTSEKVVSNCRLCLRSSQNLKRIEFTPEHA